MHGDDFVAVAEDDHLNFLERVLENSLEIKRVGRIGPGRSSAGKVLAMDSLGRQTQDCWDSC